MNNRNWFKQQYCIDCHAKLGKNAQYNETKRCLQCNGIYLSEKYIGKNNSNYRHGKTLKKYSCIDCHKEISDYRVKRCCSCEDKRRHKTGILNSKGKNNSMYGIRRYGKKAPNFIHGKCYEPYPVE
jgi:hypothetical protein